MALEINPFQSKKSEFNICVKKQDAKECWGLKDLKLSNLLKNDAFNDT